MNSRYTPGHGENASTFMAARSFESHAQFFAPHLRKGDSLVDVGCGPGTITGGIADSVSPGRVVGVDLVESQIQIALRVEVRANRNLEFQMGDCYALPFDDARFDKAFSHALIEHLSEPVKALVELRRVMKPGGVVGVCSPDWGGFVLSPTSPGVDIAIAAYMALQIKNGGDVYAGRKLGQHLASAGFSNVNLSARYECYPSSEVIAEYLALQLEREGDNNSASALRSWSRVPGSLFAQTWISAVARA